MTAPRFSITAITKAFNVRGEEMREVQLRALPSDPFNGESLPAAPPQGSVTILVSLEYAKGKHIGDEFALEARS